MYRHRRLIHLLAQLAPARDRLIATGARVFLPTQVITMLSLVLYELGTNGNMAPGRLPKALFPSDGWRLRERLLLSGKSTMGHLNSLPRHNHPAPTTASNITRETYRLTRVFSRSKQPLWRLV